MRSLLIAALLVGCKGGTAQPNVTDDAHNVDPDAEIDAPPDAYEILGSSAISGTRLKVAWVTTPDGVKIDVDFGKGSNGFPLQFKDSLLQVGCGRDDFTDGTIRCRPDAARVYYSDAQCSAPVAHGANPSPTEPYWIEYANDSSGRVAQLYALGQQVAGTQYWERVGQTCSGPLGVGIGGKLFALTPVTGLPVITEVRSGTGSLQQSWWTSADGLQVPNRGHAYDVTLGSGCYVRQKPWVIPLESAPCEPTAWETRYYHDTSCSTPVVIASPGSTLPLYVRGACSKKLHSLGGMTTASPLNTRGQGQACWSVTPSPGKSYYLFGPEVGEMQLVGLTQESAPGHRLQPITYGGNGLDMWSGFFHDSVLDLNCALGITGCRPRLASHTRRLYANAQCTVPIDVVQIFQELDPACPASRPDPFARDANNEVHRVAGQHVGSLYNKATSTCDPVSFETPPDAQFFDLDPTVIPDSAFETVTYSVDP